MFVRYVSLALITCYCTFQSSEYSSKKDNLVPNISSLNESFIESLVTQALFKNSRRNDEDNLLQKVLDTHLPKDSFRSTVDIHDKAKNLLCILCKVLVKTIFYFEKKETPKYKIRKFLHHVCGFFVNWIDPPVCVDLVNINLDTVVYIFHETKISPKKACAIFLHFRGCFKDKLPQWSVYIPNRLPENKNARMAEQESGKKPFNIIHITDAHLDPWYEAHTIVDCKRPVCCQRDQGLISDGAGYWGNYGSCDIPWYTFEALINEINNLDSAEHPFIYFTGDIISHRIWNTSVEYCSSEIKKFNKMLREKLHRFRILPAVGNHESHPANTFAPLEAPNKFSTQWLYELLATEWSHWLPESTMKTIRSGGYYSVELLPGFRVIALNFNACYSFNWWLLYDTIDVYGQLEWLIKELLLAEKKNETVHILAHGPSGEADCLTTWAQQFQRIVERFSDTIAAQFNGHTHYNEFKVFYNSSNISQPLSIAFNGASFTTFEDLNSNYRTYAIDPKTFNVIDLKEWILRIPDANLHFRNPPEWQLLYSFKHEYNIESLSLHAINGLIMRMTENKTILQRYHELKTLDSTAALPTTCDNTCMKKTLCYLVTTVYNRKEKCNQLIIYSNLTTE